MSYQTEEAYPHKLVLFHKKTRYRIELVPRPLTLPRTIKLVAGAVVAVLRSITSVCVDVAGPRII